MVRIKLVDHVVLWQKVGWEHPDFFHEILLRMNSPLCGLSPCSHMMTWGETMVCGVAEKDGRTDCLFLLVDGSSYYFPNSLSVHPMRTCYESVC